MDVIFVFILSIKFVSFVQSADKIPGVWCGFGGSEMQSSYKFSISDIPKRCDAIVYGSEYFDVTPSAEDSTAITALVAANKIVYTFYSINEFPIWRGIMKTKDLKGLDQKIDPMIKFLIKSKITGVILSYLNLLGGDIPDYVTKIQTLICKIKAAVPNIKVGLLVSAWKASQFGNKTNFDFTVINDCVDVYIIDTTAAEGKCTSTSMAQGGRLPITSNDPDVVSLKQINEASISSPMAKDKMIIYLSDYVLVQETQPSAGKTYSEYCRRTNGIWCADTMQMFYDKVKCIKGTFKGILISALDQDDFDNSCDCGKFSVANTYIDAWEDKPITCCLKI